MISLLDNKATRFILFGGYNTLFGYALFALAYLLLKNVLHYAAIATLCHFISVSHAYIIQRKFVFRSTAPWPSELLRFHMTYLAILPVSLLILWVLHEFLTIPVLVAQGITMAIVVVLSYLGSNHFTFRQK